MVPIASFKSSSIENDLQFVKYVPASSKIGDEAEIGVATMSLQPLHDLGFSVGFNQDIRPSSTL